MGRSRADEILKEWSAVSSSAERPISAPRPRRISSSAPIGFAAAGLAIVLVVALLGPQLFRGSVPANPSATPSASESTIAETSPSPTVQPTPTVEPTPTPPPLPTETPGGVGQVQVVATVPGCTYQMTPWAYADGRWYVPCTSGTTRYTAAIDVATGKIVERYDVAFGTIAVAGGGLFVSAPMGSACADPCVLSGPLKRIDLRTKQVTAQIPERFVVGTVGNYVLVAHQDPHDGPGVADPAYGLEKVDPVTGQIVGKIAISSPYVRVGAGSLWTADSSGSNAPVLLEQLSLDDGHLLATYRLPAMPDPGWPQRSGDTAWVAVGTTTSNYMIKLDDQRDPSTSPNLLQAPLLLGSDLYMWNYQGKLALLDQKTWTPVKTWQIPGGVMQPVAIGDTLWIDGGNGIGLQKIELK